jgi:hypothetical protein
LTAVATLGLVGDVLIGGIYGLLLVILFTVGVPTIGALDQPAQLAFGSGVMVMAAVIGATINVVVIVGAARMKRLEDFRLAVIAAVLAAIPGISPCFLVGVPFGIWAIVVLSDGSVKAAFQTGRVPMESESTSHQIKSAPTMPSPAGAKLDSPGQRPGEPGRNPDIVSHPDSPRPNGP